jgi:two-component system, chemotaxis family, protein-glutamate methylesterase/glutaminase
MEWLSEASRIVVLGASAGAVEVLGQLLPALPSDFPWPVLVVVHLPARAPSLLVPLFAPRCGLRMCDAEDKQPLAPSTVYFAPPDYHLLVESRELLALSIDPPVQFSRPSIDVLFHSAAAVFGPAALGILLSGANSDGAAGLRAICDAGGLGWVQDPATAVARQMPLAALRRVPTALTLAPAALAQALCHLAQVGS